MALTAGSSAACSNIWAAQFNNTQQVVLISVDGLRADTVNSEHMPLLDKRLKRGAYYSLKARNVMPSNTLPNHASMLSGLDPSHHHVLFNHDLLVRQLRFREPDFALPTLFSVVKSEGGSVAAFVSKNKLSYLFDKAPLDYLHIEANTDIEHYMQGESSRSLIDAYMQTVPDNRYTFTFFHFREADTVGHEFAWMSNEYLQTVKVVDHQLDRLLSFIWRPNTAIVITSDHGGFENHHKADIPQNRTIPWLMLLPGRSGGKMLTFPVSVVDTAPTIAWMLGLKWPGQMQGKIVNLRHN